ncbi:ArsR family transcriptional regulator [Haloterrigena sp. H1]|uniref:ArsR family transcriptional regulator n=1 Tax=Haloterrigena sp. H1 TaxID=2552943 RepID=UPI00110D6DCE|nr:ArsR family transcriptional regulator [Haloterrigena sp. H1]TMT81459.1 ArsR family transcriptional regulator [Haloterrigena sp. H1]
MSESTDLGTILTTLADQSRRRLLMSLIEHNPQEDKVNIPEDIHMGEKELEALQSEFFHMHLPKLESEGYIRWKKDSHEVVKGPEFDEIRPLLELISNHQDELPDGWI